MSSRPSRGAARLAAILDALPDGLVLVNANGTVVNANAIALEMFESPGTALVGRGLLDLLPEFDSKLIPGSMRRPASTDARGRTKPTRMTARRTDGAEFPAEVTSASLDSRDAYRDPTGGYNGDELLMLVVRDLTGTVDTEAELARSQRQTEMILRAASEGVVGTDTDGRVVLVNPAAAQILGFRATDLGGRELHTLVLHSRANGDPFPYDESPLADTLRSGRKHRVRGQVLWAKNGSPVPVDLTTAPVRDGDQLVGAVMTFIDRRAHEELLKSHADEVDEIKESAATELKAVTDRLTGELTATERRLTSDLAAAEQRLTAERDEVEERLTAQLRETEEAATAELADRSDRYAAEIEELTEQYEFVSARHAQLTAVLGDALRGPLEELRGELATLAADPAGQLWPEANQILHHLAAGYARMTTLVDNVLGYQRLDAGTEQLSKMNVLLDGVVAAGVDGAVELIGPGRAQFAVHAPPIEAEVDPGRLATALAHLVADVAGVDATGRTRQQQVQSGGYIDSTILVAAAQRDNVVRIEVRGPFPGGDPVHGPIVQGIVRAHGGVLRTHEVPGMSGRAYALELPLGEGGGTMQSARALAPYQEATGAPGTTVGGGDVPVPTQGAGGTGGGGRRRARRSSTDAFLDSPVGEDTPEPPTGRRRARPSTENSQGGAPRTGADAAVTSERGARAAAGAMRPSGVPGAGPGAGSSGAGGSGVTAPGDSPGPAAPGVNGSGVTGGAPVGPAALGPGTGAGGASGTGRRRGRPSPADGHGDGHGGRAQGALVPAAESVRGPAGQQHATVPPQGVPLSHHRAAGAEAGAQRALPALPSGPIAPQPALADAPSLAPVPPLGGGATAYGTQGPHETQGARGTAVAAQGGPGAPSAHAPAHPQSQPTGRRARRALSQAPDHPVEPEGPRSAFALPPGAADRTDDSLPGRHDGARTAPDEDHTPPQAHPLHGTHGAQGARGPQGAQLGYQDAGNAADLGHGRTRSAGHQSPGQAQGQNQQGQNPDQGRNPERGEGQGRTRNPAAAPAPSSGREAQGEPRRAATPTAPAPAPAPAPARPLPVAQPLPDETPPAGTATGSDTQGRAFSVRTLGQGVPFARGGHAPGTPATGPLAANRRRKLGNRTEPASETGGQPQGPAPSGPQSTSVPMPPPAGGPGAGGGRAEGRSYAIGAPDEGAEGPEPLDGPGGAVEVANRPQPRPVDDELPPEPLDNPRRLLVWPAPDVSTQQALSERGYRPVVVHSREEVDAQIAAFPAALFVDPLTGPITRTALQSLRQAAVAAEVPVLVTAGLGQANREAAYGADPAVLLKALAPRDSEQHPPRVLLIEGHEEIALALRSTLERRGMQVGRAADDNEAVALAGQMRPNLVVMDLMQVRRRRAGIIDWLRANGQLNRTPLVVYTSMGIDPAELPRLVSGENVLFLAERSTSDEVQARIVDLLAKIGTN
ncbi:PAS domain-containing protein [Streptomyces sp. NBC_01497]|uniref:PAS domain-containing protein n=1 Tax=Streptomyces sp. NBC_01497 TaxID=2903885 RepID=UPI002E31CF42|nr:PAS domain-containing protein [Streptomyces sp. NBC_01497]